MECDENQGYIITGGTKKFNASNSSFFNVMIIIADRMPKSDYNHGLKIFKSCIYTHKAPSSERFNPTTHRPPSV